MKNMKKKRTTSVENFILFFHSFHFILPFDKFIVFIVLVPLILILFKSGESG